MFFQEIQIFEGWRRLGSLFVTSLPLIHRTLQIILFVILYIGGKNVVHNADSDGFTHTFILKRAVKTG